MTTLLHPETTRPDPPVDGSAYQNIVETAVDNECDFKDVDVELLNRALIQRPMEFREALTLD